MKLQKNCFGKMLCAILLLAGLVTACYDDSDVREQLRDHESRLKELERLTAQQNTNISSLQTIVTALQDKDYVTNVAPINEGDKVVGYTITFSKSGTVTIYNGKDGYVPSVGVKQDTDGLWYWTVDGEWLLDSNGYKVRASAINGEDGEPGTPGQSGVTPTLKIVDGYWYVSYDGGKTWEDDTLGQATGDNGYTMFEDVKYDEVYVYLTMNDGQVLQIPRYKEKDSYGLFELDFPEEFYTAAIIKGRLNVPTSDLPFAKVTVYYTNEEVFNIHTAYSDTVISFDSDKGFAFALSNLQCNTTYNYCVVAEVKSEKVYSDVLSFTTLEELSSLRLQDVEVVSSVSRLEIIGKISGIEGVDISKVGLELAVEYNKYNVRYYECNQISESGEFRFVFDIDCTDFWEHCCVYDYRLSLEYYQVGLDTMSGEVKTYVISPSSSLSLTSVSYDSAVFSGVVANYQELLNFQCSSQFRFGIFCGTNSDPKSNNNYQAELHDDGSFTVTVSGLSPNTKYYYGLVQTQSSSVLYGETFEFTTDEDIPIFFKTPVIKHAAGFYLGGFPTTRDFAVFAYAQDGEDAYSPGAGTVDVYMDEVKCEYVADGVAGVKDLWRPMANNYCWPTDKSLTFVAVSPSRDVPSTECNYSISSTKSALIVEYTAPADPAKQVDILYSDWKKNCTLAANENNEVYDGVELAFRHALSSVCFKVSVQSECAEVLQIKEISVDNIYKGGVFTNDFETGIKSWDFTGQTKDKYVYECPTDNVINVENFFVPQAIGDESCIAVHYLIKNSSMLEGIDQVMTFSLKQLVAEWVMGWQYVHKIVLSLDEVTCSTEVSSGGK